MEKKKQITKEQIPIGTHVIYYSIVKPDGTKLNPKNTVITSNTWEVSGHRLVKVRGITGGVSINHLELI